MNTPVYALREGTPYSLSTIHALATSLGTSSESPASVAARYKALGFTVTGLPSSSVDCAKEVLVLFGASRPPQVKEL